MNQNSNNPYKAVKEFEEVIAEYAGSKYAVAVERTSAAIFLCCEYLGVKDVFIPKYTYPSVPNAIIHTGGRVHFHNKGWKGIYELEPFNIYDAALRFKKGMYKDGFMCLSFHMKKHLPIGRGGMILLNDKYAYKWFKKARFDGRNEVPLEKDNITQLGWNFYMTPEQAIRGLELFNVIKDKDLPDLDSTKQGYIDLSKIYAYRGI
jgi:dTDP-4-amino-4,6-dideoxygalactose transaminase